MVHYYSSKYGFVAKILQNPGSAVDNMPLVLEEGNLKQSLSVK